MRRLLSLTRCLFGGLLAAGLLAGCGSEEVQKISQIQKDAKAGNTDSAYQGARDVLAAAEGTYTAEQLEEARKIFETLGRRLANAYAGQVQQEILFGDPEAALGMYEAGREEFPEMEKAWEVKIRLMRVLAKRGEYEEARTMALSVESGAEGLLATTAREFLGHLDALRAVNDRIEQLRPYVSTLTSMKDGVTMADLEMPSCSADAVAARLSEQDRQRLYEFLNLQQQRLSLESVLVFGPQEGSSPS